MDPILGGMIAGGANLLGSVFSSQTSAANTQQQLAAQQAMLSQTENFNAQQADINRRFQAGQTEEQRAFETTMSNTAYQRARKDMEAAGLNPMMMFGSGGPASTPAVSAASGGAASTGTPTVPMPQTTSPLAGIGKAAESVVSTAVNVKAMEKMAEETANLIATRGKIGAETGLIQRQTDTEAEQPAAVRQLAEQRKAAAFQSAVEAQRESLKLPEAEKTGKIARTQMDIPTVIWDAAIKSGFVGSHVNDALAPFVSAAKGIGSFMNRWGSW